MKLNRCSVCGKVAILGIDDRCDECRQYEKVLTGDETNGIKS
jgi:hypothetical protein